MNIEKSKKSYNFKWRKYYILVVRKKGILVKFTRKNRPNFIFYFGQLNSSTRQLSSPLFVSYFGNK